MTSVALPYQSPVLRLFHAASQYVAGPVAGRGTIRAELVGADADLADVRLLLVARDSSDYREVASSTASVETDATGANQVVAVVVNVAEGGASRRPVLCFGSPQEVSACREALVPGSDAAPAKKNQDDGCSAAAPQLLVALWVLLKYRFTE